MANLPPPPLIRFRLIKKAGYKCSRINHCLIRTSLVHKDAHLLIIKCVHLYAMSIIHLLLGVFPIPVEGKQVGRKFRIWTQYQPKTNPISYANEIINI